MKLPIRNYHTTPLTILIEPYALTYEVPPGGQAIIKLDDGCSHSIDLHPGQHISVWDDGGSSGFAEVDILTEHQ